ncbi:cobaltochelatase subunit CobN [Lichenifustis flavocetrariae]|uniref:Cobaltochelatase subunit CobN n=1 Tax=Lichenifustis flavocetrariae TaxID=2949735 RepID=A0AA41Z0P7_9HYPH|nr:cobaltochelatase subunit CobN [Lichenifustis flavocetrariae]MCW6510648.1 cobaltochelatase subunit CobN [Lichenifustis flavocetrariae]
MHLLPTQRRSLDAEVPAIDLDRSPADLVMLSFSDSDLAVAAAAWEGNAATLPSLRLANLSKLRHPYSVDLFIEKTAAKARFVLVRLLGGLDYWRYGVEELAAAARRNGFALAVLAGDQVADERLEAASTLPAERLRELNDYFFAGGIDNVTQALRFVASVLGDARPVAPPRAVPLAGLHMPSCRAGAAEAPHALILFYRSALLANDIDPIVGMADAMAARGARVSAFFVSSLKDEEAAEALEVWLTRESPDVILNTTAFSAQRPSGCVTDRADAPVLQVVLSTADRVGWLADARGLGAADLAMNVVLPEVDGRIAAGVVSFKTEADAQPDLEFGRVSHRIDPERIVRVAERALAWAALRRTPRAERRLACILSDYPGKGGRVGQAVGLDTPASVVEVAAHLERCGFDAGGLPKAEALMQGLTSGLPQPCLSLDAYRTGLARLPKSFVATLDAAWGVPENDASCVDGQFRFRLCRAGKLWVAVQPDRGSQQNRRAEYHDTALPPRHGYVAFYLWLRQAVQVHALIHMGTHGTLEWLPGKAVALSEICAPDVLIGATPVIYPFIVNNPGEAAQAKRRLGAVTIGHLTPPLVAAGLHGDTAELEQLFDEYAEAVALDARRARLLGAAILEKAEAAGLTTTLGAGADSDTMLAALDAWLCDIKEARIGDGLHVFGAPPPAWSEGGEPKVDPDLLAACGCGERDHLVAALDGRFVPPGPSGAPSAGRMDVLPTGRNLFSVDPRAIPTRTGWEIGARLAEDLVTRYAQDHGDWPRRVVLDLWGSATMRTGGQDLGQAFALIGTKPIWDHSSNRVTGFEILPLARLGRSRVDTTLRVSGLFRDTFPDQITTFDAAVRAVSGLDEAVDDNPLVEARQATGDMARVFGTAPGQYGAGLGRMLADDSWGTREELGDAYLAATTHAYARGGVGQASPEGFGARIATADAFAHTGDLPGQDILDSDVFAEHEGGFAAAAARLGANPSLYRADTTNPDAMRLRSLAEDIERALLARAANPRWIAGQRCHGYAGAAAMADTLDALFGFAATTDAVPPRHFDRYFDATLGNEEVRAFLQSANPAAAEAMADRFDAAIRRGFWPCRRNSTLAILADTRATPA